MLVRMFLLSDKLIYIVTKQNFLFGAKTTRFLYRMVYYIVTGKTKE